MTLDAARRRRHRAAPACWPCSATAITTDHISPGRQHPRPTARPAKYLVGAAASQPTDFNSVRRAPRQPRGDDARHVRQHPPAATSSCPAPRAASRVHLPERRGDADLRRRDEVPGRGRAARRSSPARSTASGSSRDWAAKGTALLGVKAVIAESFERIHRSQPRSAWACCRCSSCRASPWRPWA
ncbi:MAG: hypothetical protein MZV64_28165 [Ignavibacteriales bacterium]|nr:hypothetical protein [Ignavibacteriales bacterium]